MVLFWCSYLAGLPWEGGAVASNLSRKCEALAVSGLVEYGDEIDVIAPADILKQIFKMPYSKARLSIGVHRIGQTLVLNTGWVIAYTALFVILLHINPFKIGFFVNLVIEV